MKKKSSKVELPKHKYILDATCGSRMCWFDKNHKNVIYADIRELNCSLNGGGHIVIKPDIINDFTDMIFDDKTFNLILLDPPHLNSLSNNTWMAQKYGQLLPTWETDIKAAVNESMRVLKPKGILILKWNEVQIKLSHLLEVLDISPLFGHTSGKHGRTIWLCFMKI